MELVLTHPDGPHGGEEAPEVFAKYVTGGGTRVWGPGRMPRQKAPLRVEWTLTGAGVGLEKEGRGSRVTAKGR